MFEKIFNTLFEKKRKIKCMTVIKNREIVCDGYVLLAKNNKQVIKTCLSEYFKNRKGLNVDEREKFYTAVLSARSPQ